MIYIGEMYKKFIAELIDILQRVFFSGIYKYNMLVVHKGVYVNQLIFFTSHFT
jgi:hypothetical protein